MIQFLDMQSKLGCLKLVPSDRQRSHGGGFLIWVGYGKYLTLEADGNCRHNRRMGCYYTGPFKASKGCGIWFEAASGIILDSADVPMLLLSEAWPRVAMHSDLSFRANRNRPSLVVTTPTRRPTFTADLEVLLHRRDKPLRTVCNKHGRPSGELVGDTEEAASDQRRETKCFE